MDFIGDLNFTQPATKGTAGTNKSVLTLAVTDVMSLGKIKTYKQKTETCVIVQLA